VRTCSCGIRCPLFWYGHFRRISCLHIVGIFVLDCTVFWPSIMCCLNLMCGVSDFLTIVSTHRDFLFKYWCVSGIYKMSHVHHVVLDEADTLLDDSFNEKICHFLRKFQVSILQTSSVLSCCSLFTDIVKLLNWSGWCMETLKLKESVW